MKSSPRRGIRIPTPESLGRAALRYLERYAASEASLRRVLANRIRRAAVFHPAFAADRVRQGELQAAIDRIAALHKRTGALNDPALAEMKVASLRRAGRSARAIRQKLALQGLSKTDVAKALDAHDAESGDDADRRAARACARRRRLGPFRVPPDDTPERRRKDFAALARAGFASVIIRDILNLRSGEADDDMFAD